jgi:hypothetical protein
MAQLAPVYAIVVVILYMWSLMRFFWRLPSFINYSTPGEIFVIYSYLTSIDFLESLIIIAAPIFLSMVLPQRWFRDRFTAKGVLLVLMGLGYLIYISTRIVEELPFPYALFQWSPVFLFLILALALLLGEIKFLAKILDDLSDRFVIFLYISIPISVICVIVVLVRNIF